MKKIRSILEKPYLYIAIVCIGSVLKFINLEEKHFWEDEISVVLHTSGVSHDAYMESFPVNIIVDKSYYIDLLKLNDRNLNIKDQFIGLMKMPQLSPGHYYYLIFWVRIFGDDPITFRYFTILCYFLALAFLFLFVRLLFNSSQMGWIALCLFSLSPFFQVYAQEARYYMLWAASICIFSYVFLKSLEKQSTRWWIYYVLTGFLTVHVTLLNFALLGVHLLYYLVFIRRNFKCILISQTAVVMSASPWLIHLFLNRFAITEGLAWQQHPIFGEWHFWPLVKNVFSSFINTLFIHSGYLDWRFGGFKYYEWSMWLLSITAFIFFIIYAGKKQKVFVLSLILFGAVILLAGDLFRKSFGSVLNKYHLMVYMGILILGAYGFNLLREKKSILFTILLPIVLTGGFLSSLGMARNICEGKNADCQWHINDANELYAGNNKVLIITDYQLMIPNWFPPFLAMLNTTNNPNIDVLYMKPNYPDALCDDFNLENYDNIYCTNMSDVLRTYIDSTFTTQIEILRDEKMYGFIEMPLYSLNTATCKHILNE